MLEIQKIGLGLIINNLQFIQPFDRVDKSGNIRWSMRCFCGNIFITTPQRIVAKTTSSCGCYRRKVASEAQKLRVGSKHPNWNPNLTNEDRLYKRAIRETVNWRNEVYIRDCFTCIKCKKVGGKINAHHIDGWNWCVEKRFDINNGATLCIGCHTKFHSIYGRGDNTSWQFEQFLTKDDSHERRRT